MIPVVKFGIGRWEGVILIVKSSITSFYTIIRISSGCFVKSYTKVNYCKTLGFSVGTYINVCRGTAKVAVVANILYFYKLLSMGNNWLAFIVIKMIFSFLELFCDFLSIFPKFSFLLPFDQTSKIIRVSRDWNLIQ